MFSKKSYAVAILAAFFGLSSYAIACTMETPSLPEIEIEIEFEDYDLANDLVIYWLKIEVEVVPPSSNTQCQCSIALGSFNQAAPASFRVLDAVVAIKNDEFDEDIELPEFGGFASDTGVSKATHQLPGFNTGATAIGMSTSVAPFTLPPLNSEDRLVLGFRIAFTPGDFDAVNGNVIQFAAGSTEPGHPLAFINNFPPTLQMPPFQLNACDTNFDQVCNVSDVNAILALGPINVGVPRTDVTEVYDLSGDDVIDIQDVATWLQKAAAYNGRPTPYRFGDANLDGGVNVQDFLIWFRNRNTPKLSWSNGNFNGDGFVSSQDFVIWRNNRGL